MPGPAWARLSRLLELHLEAEQEICYPAIAAARPPDGLLHAAAAGHFDIREALAEAQLLPPGSCRWQRAVTDACRAALRHFQAEEDRLLPALRQAASPEVRHRLGRQWTAFITARLLDDAAGPPPAAGQAIITGTGPGRAISGPPANQHDGTTRRPAADLKIQGR